jgi:hypothetical protein
LSTGREYESLSHKFKGRRFRWPKIKLSTLGDPVNFTNDVATNLFLYGTKETPPEFFNRIRPEDAPHIVVELDMHSFMSSGPGRYALPSLAPFVQKFFADDLGLSQALQNRDLHGPYTVGELEELGVSDKEFHIELQQSFISQRNLADRGKQGRRFYGRHFLRSIRSIESSDTASGLSFCLGRCARSPMSRASAA